MSVAVNVVLAAVNFWWAASYAPGAWAFFNVAVGGYCIRGAVDAISRGRL